MSSVSFDTYIKNLREDLINLIKYKLLTGQSQPNLLQIKNYLFDEDPFVVLDASIVATAVLSDKNIYH